MNILVLNAGSSSLKFQVIESDHQKLATNTDRRLARGIVERIGSQGLIRFESAQGAVMRDAQPVRDHRAAVDIALRWLISDESGIPEITSLASINAVGHRVAHGGEKFKQSTRITPEVVAEIEECIELAPLHNPANLNGIRAITEMLGTGVPQAAVFDTSFHQSIPEKAYLYALPYQFYRRHKIRRYGFHGTSHRSIAYRYRQLLGIERSEVTIITLHLGNGCSATAIRNGDSVDTSMGLTPLEGLVMGTRSGDIDPAIIEFLMSKEGYSIHQLDTVLNKQSGLLGISGLTNDMRELLDEERESGDRRARLAIDIFVERVRKYIGAYMVTLGGPQAVVFGGGIGENSPEIRRRILHDLDWCGLQLDNSKNEKMTGGSEGEISTDHSTLKAYVIPTDEELMIARDTLRIITN